LPPEEIQKSPMSDASRSAKDFNESVAELSQLLLSRESLEVTLQRVAKLAVRSVRGCDSAGVALLERGRLVTAAASDRRAREVDSFQHRFRQGPCVDAINTHQMQLAPYLIKDDRWPRFGPLAAKHGVRSILAFPLLARDELLGSLNVYSLSEDAFDKSSQEIAEVFAGRAAVAIYNAHVFTKARTLVEQLEEALESRPLIEQAKGILMQRKRISADAAFDELRQKSQQQNRKLRAVAQELVDSVSPS
jgi:GAF domain-containing protein